MAVEELNEFDELVGTEYKEPVPDVDVYFRYMIGGTSMPAVCLSAKSRLPADATYMGLSKYDKKEEWWSKAYHHKYGHLFNRFMKYGIKNPMGINTDD